MQRTIKIFEDDKIIYERNLSVNTAILKGRIYKNPTSFGESVHFTLEISGGKDAKTNEWRKPIYADCTAFGELRSKISNLHKKCDEIFVLCRLYLSAEVKNSIEKVVS